MKNAKMIFFIIFAIISSIIIIFFEYKKNLTIETILDSDAREIALEFDSIYKKHKLFANLIFDSYIKSDTSILQIIAYANETTYAGKKELRDALYSRLLEKYSYLSSILNIRQLHFHLRDNESFLRMHKPSKFGDNLTFVRSTVAYTNKFKKAVDGFEEGRIYNGFRFVYPLFNEGTHIGSVEVSFSSYEIISNMIADFNIASNLLISDSVIQKKVFDDEKSNYSRSIIQNYSYDNEVVQKLGQRFKVNDIASRVVKEKIEKQIPLGEPFSLYDEPLNQVITIIPQKNPISGVYVAAFIVKSDAKSIESVTDNFYFLIFFSIFLLFIIIYFFYMKSSYDVKMLRQNHRMKAILNSQSIITLVHENRELKNVNSAFFEFFTQYKTLEEFKKEHACICDFFEETNNENYLSPNEYPGDAWIKKVLQNPHNTYKVSMQKEGVLYHFAIRIESLKDDHANNSFVISLLDITNDIALREKIQMILNFQSNMIIILNQKQEISYANQKFLSFFKLSNIEEFQTKFSQVEEMFEKELPYFTPTKQNWMQELLSLAERERVVCMIDKNDLAKKAFLVHPVYLQESNTWICSFTEYTQFALETQELTKRVYLDELTLIPNRAKFNEEIKREIDFYERYDTDFCLVLFDIDFFKNINDTWGHDIGDRILKELSSLVSNNIRNTDIFARWGGEEFVIIMHQTTPQNALHIIESLREEIERTAFYNSIALTCSFGITQIIKHDTRDRLFKRADTALYLAKNSGRNCVKFVAE